MIQIDMPMPEACDVCPFNYDFCWCNAFGNHDEWEKYSDDWNENVCERTTRPEYCPLKEHEAVEPRTEPSAKGYWFTCGACGWWLFEVRDSVHFDDRKRIHYCASCGQAVKWE